MTRRFIAPSLLAADPLNLGREISLIHKAGADILHFDVMDGHYVPNLTFGPHFVKAIKNTYPLPIDVHLMVESPSTMVPWFVDAGAHMISFHPEAEHHPYRLLQSIQSKGIKAGIVLNPGSSITLLEPLTPVLDFVLVMSVNPGFGGQAFIPSSIDKIKAIRSLYPSLEIEVDGGVDEKNASSLWHAGANILVAGSSIFGNAESDYPSTILTLRS
jgi:ribulose-phosphate 3-epimerase